FNNPAGTSYYAVLDAAGTAHTISLNSGLRLASLRLDSSAVTVNHTSGVFTLDGTGTIARGIWRLDGGTIRGGTLNVAEGLGDLQFSGNSNNILDGVTLADRTILHSNSGFLGIRNGLTFTSPNALLRLSGNGTSLNFFGSQVVPAGTIELRGGSASLNLQTDVGSIAPNLTFSSGTVVRGSQATIATGALNGALPSTLTNFGLISADTPGGVFNVGPNVLINNGTLEATNGGNLSIGFTSWTTSGVIRVDHG